MTVYAESVISSSVVTSDKERRILDAAGSLFLRYGVKRTSIDDVAREAGIAKGTIYLYYASKERLFAAVAQRICTDLDRSVCAAAAGPGSLAERLAAMLDARVGALRRLLAQSPHVAELIESKATLASDVLTVHERRMNQRLRAFLRDGNIVHEGAPQMFVAAAIGALHTGDSSERAYRTRLLALVETLLTGLQHSTAIPRSPRAGRQKTLPT